MNWRIPLASILLSFVFLRSARADEHSWDNLKGLSRDQSIVVVTRSMKSAKGKLAQVTDDAITVRVSGSEKSFARADVLRVTLVGKRRNGRYMLLGAAIGGAAGFAFYKAFGGGDEGGAAILVPLAAVGAGIASGTAVGASLPRGNRTIYRVTNPASR